MVRCLKVCVVVLSVFGLIACDGLSSLLPEAPEPKLSLFLEEVSLNLSAGESKSLVVTVITSDIEEAVQVELDGLPLGVSGFASALDASGKAEILFSSSFATDTTTTQVQVKASAGGLSDSKLLSLTVEGESNEPEPSLSNLVPSSLSLSAALSSAAKGIISFENKGDADLTYSATTESDFVSLTNPSGTLTPNQKATLEVGAQCADAVTTLNGVINLTSSAGNRTVPITLICSETAPETGTLVITLNGVPTGATPNVQVSSEAFSQTLNETSTLSDLNPTDYTITASDLIVDDKSFLVDQKSQSVTVNAGGVAVVSLSYRLQAPTTGSLTVTINGTDNADVLVSNNNGFSRSLNTTQTLEGLEPATYTVAAKTITEGADSFVANPASQTIDVIAGQSKTASISYSKQEQEKATLVVTVTGLREGANANIELTRPDQLRQTLTQNEILTLEPGIYKIQAFNTKPDSATFSPNETQELELELIAGESSIFSVNYVCTNVLPPDPLVDTSFQIATGKTEYDCNDLANLNSSISFVGSLEQPVTSIEGIQYAVSIEQFGLFRHSLTTLPVGIFDDLTNLKTLRIGSSLLSNLPAGIFDQLSQLSSLSLRSNQLSSLPDDIFDQLSQLETLDLHDNQLSSLPDGIFDQLSQLSSLSLSSNQLSSLLDGIFGQLSQLERLSLSVNQISDIPASIFNNLTELRSLSLSNNQLENLPVGIFNNLTQLKSLFLQSNQISDLPDGVFDNLINLNFLSLYDNQLTSLPELDLARNPALQDLPNGDIGGFMFVNGNKLSKLGTNLHQFLLPYDLSLQENCLLTNSVPYVGFFRERSRLGKVSFFGDNPLPDCPEATATPLVNEFTKSTEGWVFANNGDLLTPTIVASGGNPEGYLSASDGDATSSWSWRAPYYYYGDASLYIGGSFSFSLQAVTPERRPTISVTFVGAGKTINFNSGQAPSSSDWVEVSIPLSHTGWTENGLPISESTFTTVMTDLQDVRISGEYGLSTSGGSGALDSVSFVGP